MQGSNRVRQFITWLAKEGSVSGKGGIYGTGRHVMGSHRVGDHQQRKTYRSVCICLSLTGYSSEFVQCKPATGNKDMDNILRKRRIRPAVPDDEEDSAGHITAAVPVVVAQLTFALLQFGDCRKEHRRRHHRYRFGNLS